MLVQQRGIFLYLYLFCLFCLGYWKNSSVLLSGASATRLWYDPFKPSARCLLKDALYCLMSADNCAHSPTHLQVSNCTSEQVAYSDSREFNVGTYVWSGFDYSDGTIMDGGALGMLGDRAGFLKPIRWWFQSWFVFLLFSSLRLVFFGLVFLFCFVLFFSFARA